MIFQKIYEIQPVPPSMPLEALSVRFLDIHSAFSGTDEAQVVIIYFFA